MSSILKAKAIQLRKEGKTYGEILTQIPVAKSTLAGWLGSVGLSVPQKQRITKLRREAALRGARARRNTRLAEISSLRESGRKEIGRLSARERWLIGIALYWAEGSKQRETSRSAGIQFTNSDPGMLSVFLGWLHDLHTPKNALIFELYVHENRKSEIPGFKRWWARELQISPKMFTGVYLKRDKGVTNRKNTADLYHGLVRIKVRSSTSFNRRVSGWIGGIVHQK